MSIVKTDQIQDRNGNPLIAVADGVASGSFAPVGMRNRIINGDMRIDQRNNGASVGTSTGSSTYTLDRWQALYAQASKYTVQQNAGAVTPPAGFASYLGVTSLSAYSVTSSDFFNILQKVEGFNVADFGWGTANAQPVTLSFWVRSSLTGNFGGAFQNSAQSRSYPFTYTVTSANTWEYKTVTVPGDTTGTWLTNNGRGVWVIFNLGAGANFEGTANTWIGANRTNPTGATSVVGTNGATFYITGVQLEAGTVATPFERRQFGQELALCQRYYHKTKATVLGFRWGVGVVAQATEVIGTFNFPTEMRTNPSALETTGTATDYSVRIASNIVCNSTPVFASANGVSSTVNFSVSGGLTSGQAISFRANDANAFLAWSAEL